MIFIGTLHGGITPVKELINLIGKFHPDQILVEIVDSDLTRGSVAKYPSEMRAVLAWARRRKVSIKGFDARISTFKEGLTVQDNKKTIRDQLKIIGDRSWKLFNKDRYLKMLDTPSFDALVDMKKYRQREYRMAKNIRKRASKSGSVVVVTGCGHLSYFESVFRQAKFPLRRS